MSRRQKDLRGDHLSTLQLLSEHVRRFVDLTLYGDHLLAHAERRLTARASRFRQRHFESAGGKL
jgi:hypothetical protein